MPAKKKLQAVAQGACGLEKMTEELSAGKGVGMRNMVPVNDDSLSAYLAEVRRHPMLTAEEELDLARRWRDGKDREALSQLVGSHLRLVVRIARDNGGYGLPMADLIAEGNVGLMQAAEKFDPERGFRFATYALWWVRASIRDYILRSWSLVRTGTTAAQKKLFFKLRRLKSSLGALEEGDMSPELVAKIAEELQVPETEVVEMNRRLTQSDRSLDAPVGADGEDSWLDLLGDEREGQEGLFAESEEMDKRRALMHGALAELNERERHILVERKLKDEPMTLQELSEIYGVSRERVRQIEGNALRKLTKSMRARAAESGLDMGRLDESGSLALAAA